MGICITCNEETKYHCIQCKVFICNRSLDCHVPFNENSFPGGRQAAIFHACETTHGEPSSEFGLRQFEILCASHGIHVYRDVWRHVHSEHLEMDHDFRDVHDLFAVSIKAEVRGRLTNPPPPPPLGAKIKGR